MCVLGRRGRTVLGPLRDALERVHHAAHEDGAEEVLERTEDVDVEQQREQADDDEEVDNREVDELCGKLDETFVEKNERQSSHDARLCQPADTEQSE